MALPYHTLNIKIIFDKKTFKLVNQTKSKYKHCESDIKNHGTVQKVVVLYNRTMQMLVKKHRKGGIRQCAVK